MLAYGARGDAWFDALAAGGSPGHVVTKPEAMQLASTLRKLMSSPALSSPPFAPMVERLGGLVGIIEGAASALD